MPGDLESQRQAGIVTVVFNRIHGLPAHLKGVAQLLLGLSPLVTKASDLVFHRYRHFNQTRPSK